MHTRGTFSPETEAAVRERYGDLEPVAQTVVREVAKGMGFDREEYEERVTPAVVARARDTLFAERLAVIVGSRSEFESWGDGYDGEVIVYGGENVDNVAWHPTPFDVAVAATFQSEEDAAVATLRRQALGRVYRERL